MLVCTIKITTAKVYCLVPFSELQGISRKKKKKKSERRDFPDIFSATHCTELQSGGPAVVVRVCLAPAARCRSGAGRGGLCGGKVGPDRQPQQPQCQRLEGPEVASCSAPSGSPKPGRPAAERLCRQRGLCAGWDLRVPASQK